MRAKDFLRFYIVRVKTFLNYVYELYMERKKGLGSLPVVDYH